MHLKDKKILVVGCGKTGIAVCRFLLNRGASVSITDCRRKVDLPKKIMSGLTHIETGGHRIETFTSQDLIVMSPGVPLFIRPVIEAQAKGIDVISEIELACKFIDVPLIAITGTNGKTTTTSLLSHIFESCGKKVFVGGNIGTPLIEYVNNRQQAEYVIAEISSFQLECIKNFKPHISVLLNLTEDHLDRYPSFEDYISAKTRIFLNQAGTDIAVLNFDDHRVKELADKIHAEPFFFSTKTELKTGAYYNGKLRFSHGNSHKASISMSGVMLQGDHNRENLLAAVSVCLLCKLPEENISKAITTFSGLPHRMEFVAKAGNITFINDSKGTNVGACVKSLSSIEGPVILVAGGKDKGGSYTPLKKIVRDKVKALILIGEAKQRMQEEFGSEVPSYSSDTLESAVKLALSKTTSGDTVLFSPACSSFDMFKNYEQRGESFKKIVRNLIIDS